MGRAVRSGLPRTHSHSCGILEIEFYPETDSGRDTSIGTSPLLGGRSPQPDLLAPAFFFARTQAPRPTPIGFQKDVSPCEAPEGRKIVAHSVSCGSSARNSPSPVGAKEDLVGPTRFSKGDSGRHNVYRNYKNALDRFANLIILVGLYWVLLTCCPGERRL